MRSAKWEFIYADGSSDESTIESHSSYGFVNRTYINPHLLKHVGSVEVWLRQSTFGNDKEPTKEILSYMVTPKMRLILNRSFLRRGS